MFLGGFLGPPHPKTRLKNLKNFHPFFAILGAFLGPTGEKRGVHVGFGPKRTYGAKIVKVGVGGRTGPYTRPSQSLMFGLLNFVGPNNWLLYLENGGTNIEATFEKPLVTTTEGTTPEGSEWATIEIPDHTEYPFAFGIMDLVHVPESLEPGDYVLSFRWDCQKTPQIWQTCANVLVI